MAVDTQSPQPVARLLHNQFMHAENKHTDPFNLPFSIPKTPCDPKDQAGLLSVLTTVLNHEQSRTNGQQKPSSHWEVKTLPVTYKHPLRLVQKYTFNY